MKPRKSLMPLSALLILMTFAGFSSGNQAMSQLEGASYNADQSYDGGGGRTGDSTVKKQMQERNRNRNRGGGSGGGGGGGGGSSLRKAFSSIKPYISAGLVGGLMGFLLFGPAGVAGGALLAMAGQMFMNI